MKTIVLDGQEYELVPVSKPPPVETAPAGLLESYLNSIGDITIKIKPTNPPAKSELKIAQPKLSEYRERYKKHDIRLSDVVPPRNYLKQIPRQDHQLDNFSYKGEKLFFGTGVEQEAG